MYIIVSLNYVSKGAKLKSNGGFTFDLNGEDEESFISSENYDK